jgi:hypothetical protein
MKRIQPAKQIKISPARFAAFEILLRIESEKAFSSVLLPIYERELSTKDRALCHALTLGVLRKKLYLDRIIEQFTKKKTEKLDLAVCSRSESDFFKFYFLIKFPHIRQSTNRSISRIWLESVPPPVLSTPFCAVPPVMKLNLNFLMRLKNFQLKRRIRAG